MTLQLEIEGIAPPSIATRKGRMKLSSLRPGDWVGSPSLVTSCVLINSAKLGRIVYFCPLLNKEWSMTYPYFEISFKVVIGHGSKRRWHAWLPKFLQKRICPFNRPKP